MEEDTEEREAEMAADLKAVLKKHKVLERFEHLSYSNKLENVFWIEEAKKPETWLSRIAKMMEKLGDGE